MIGNHSLHATGITHYLKSDGSLAEARKMANHADTRPTQLYDRQATAPLSGSTRRWGSNDVVVNA
jgi:hypothetical protein